VAFAAMPDHRYIFIAAVPLGATVIGLFMAVRAAFGNRPKASVAWLAFSFFFPILYLLADGYWEYHINTHISRGWTLILTSQSVLISLGAAFVTAIYLLEHRLRKSAKHRR
jgi:hypothetical protein